MIIKNGVNYLQITELSIVVPTYNEKTNIYKLIKSLQVVLKEVNWEIIFVDDNSPDKTADEVRKISQVNSKVHIIHRILILILILIR